MTSIHLDLEHFSFTDLAIQSAFGLVGLVFVLLFHGVTINFIEVDCDKDTALAEKFNVQGYPTIKLVRGNQVIEYDAKPNKDNLMEFLNTSL